MVALVDQSQCGADALVDGAAPGVGHRQRAQLEMEQPPFGKRRIGSKSCRCFSGR
jgi:hypothetical protein